MGNLNVLRIEEDAEEYQVSSFKRYLSCENLIILSQKEFELFGFKVRYGPRMIYRLTPKQILKIKHITFDLTQRCRTPYLKARYIIRWMHKYFLLIPYKKENKQRHIFEILKEREGNCWEQVVCAMVMLRSIGIPCRLVSEVHYKESKFPFLIKLFKSIFSCYPADGCNYSSYCWLEVFIDRRWIPADPAMGIFGIREWLEARLISRREMFPILIFSEKGRGVASDMESRTKYYLLDCFDYFYRIRSFSEYKIWRKYVREMADRYNSTIFWEGVILNKEVGKIIRLKKALDVMCKKGEFYPSRVWNLNY
jgi:hypothetical protein